MFKKNKGLLEKKRFERFQREEELLLRKLSIKKSIKILEGLLDSGIIDELKNARRQLN